MGYHVWLQYSVQGGQIILLWAVWGGPLLRGGRQLCDSATVCSCECVVLMEGGEGMCWTASIYPCWNIRLATTTAYTSFHSLGCEYLRELHLGGNAQYSSEQIIRELLQSLSSVIEEQILSELTSSELFALMTDESTDVAILKQLVLVVSYVMEEGIKTSFVHIRDLDNGTAESIEAALVQFLSDKAIQITKLRGFGSNGAAVMTGRLTGVATRLKRHSPRMIAVHC